MDRPQTVHFYSAQLEKFEKCVHLWDRHHTQDTEPITPKVSSCPFVICPFCSSRSPAPREPRSSVTVGLRAVSRISSPWDDAVCSLHLVWLLSRTRHASFMLLYGPMTGFFFSLRSAPLRGCTTVYLPTRFWISGSFPPFGC